MIRVLLTFLALVSGLTAAIPSDACTHAETVGVVQALGVESVVLAATQDHTAAPSRMRLFTPRLAHKFVRAVWAPSPSLIGIDRAHE